MDLVYYREYFTYGESCCLPGALPYPKLGGPLRLWKDLHVAEKMEVYRVGRDG
jgi:hypothetical protein